ncbi:MAG: efflux RND transporter periplasmic adaptor subunit [Rikenellaceae bacterium]|nr:efflux RND transporter periplasmic adaptor subunit [Rikenellaceae bacterium]
MRRCCKALALLLSVGIVWSCSRNPETDRSEIASPVSVAEIKPAAISKIINTSGTARANNEVELFSRMAGNYQLQRNPATGAPYKLGDKVASGQTIIKLEDKEYENNIAIDTRRLNLDLAMQEEISTKSLYDKGGVTQTDIKNAEIKVINAKYEYENGELSLDNMKIVAPFGGTIVNLPHFTQNTRVEQGESMISIMDYSKMYMEINLPESAISDVKVGQQVAITHYTMPYDTLSGTIAELSPAISTETRTFKGKISIDNGGLKIRPGMFVKADVIVDYVENTIVVPKSAVVSNRNEKYVYIVERNTALRRNINTGIEDEDNIQVTSGLKMGDNLVTKGQETLRDNSKVKIQNQIEN